MQYQGSPPTTPELQARLDKIARALLASINHRPDGLTLAQASRLPDDELLRIRGIGRFSLRLIRNHR
jgi:hypothetical protein